MMGVFVDVIFKCAMKMLIFNFSYKGVLESEVFFIHPVCDGCPCYLAAQPTKSRCQHCCTYYCLIPRLRGWVRYLGLILSCIRR